MGELSGGAYTQTLSRSCYLPTNNTLARMNLRALSVAAIAALTVIGVVSLTYIATFGISLSPSQERWGQFGDYFGGLLNPLFALAAFLSALWSISLQQREARAAGEQLAAQTEIARKEFEAFGSERLGEEFLLVIRDLDQRLSAVLQRVIPRHGAFPETTIALMVAEANRLANSGEPSPSFRRFLLLASASGTDIEADVREIKYLVNKLREFLGLYSNHKATGFAPVLLYYADKAYQLMNMLEAVGGMPEDTRKFFATVSDPHG